LVHFWDAWASFWDPGAPSGTVLGPKSNLGRFPGEILTPFWHNFWPLGDTFALTWASEAEKIGFWRQLNFRSHFCPILDQILEGLGPPKRGFRLRGVAKTAFSLNLEFCRFWTPFWRSFGVKKQGQIAIGIDFWGPGRAKWSQKLELVFEGVFGCRQDLLEGGVLVP